MHLLDTTVLIDFLRGRPVVQRLAGLRVSGEVPATTAINVEEIVRGLRTNETDAARRLFDGLEMLPIDTAVAWQAGQLRREYASRGVILYQTDCLIAAAAISHHAILATGNPKEFPMDGLTVEHWPVGR